MPDVEFEVEKLEDFSGFNLSFC